MTKIIVYSILIVILLLISFFVSSFDMSLNTISKSKIEDYSSKSNSMVAKWAKKLHSNYDKSISAVLLLNNLVNIAFEIILSAMFISIAKLNEFDPSLMVLYSTIGAFFVVCLFGEIIPKIIGKLYPLAIIKFVTPIVIFFYYIFYPFTFILSKFCELITYPIRKNIKDIQISDDDLIEMVDEFEDRGAIDEDKAEIIRSTISYANKEAFEVMTPRVNVFAIDIEDKIEDILKEEDFYFHSRIPVYKESIDNIIGFVYSKEIIRIALNNDDETIKDILINIPSFPRSCEINDIFKQFKKDQIHIGVVLDEYGGTEGIITMEDIVEEIVGEIWDEQDDKDKLYSENKDGSYIIDGQMNLEDFFDLFGIDKDELQDTEYVSIGGFCIELLDDRFANVGDEIYFKSLYIKVLAVDDKKTIEKLYCKRLEEE